MDNLEELTIDDRIKLFYTNDGFVGKSALELLFDALKPFDDTIALYESQKRFEPDLYELTIAFLELVNRLMNKFYYIFYDDIETTNEKDRDNQLKQLRAHQHNVVKVLTKELVKRRLHYPEYRREYHGISPFKVDKYK